MSGRRTTLFVAGFGHDLRAKDLAREFERYGRLVRCDIPAPRTYTSKIFAFVEFVNPRDASDAWHEMQGRRVDGHTLDIQWARNAPSRTWRYEEREEGREGGGGHDNGRRRRSHSPDYRSHSREDRGRSDRRSPPPRHDRRLSRRDDSAENIRSRSPVKDRAASRSPLPKENASEKNGDAWNKTGSPFRDDAVMSPARNREQLSPQP